MSMYILHRLFRSRKVKFISITLVAVVVAATVWQPLASAAPAQIQVGTATSNSASTSIAKAFSSANTAGNLIVAVVSWNSVNTGTFTCSDTRANTYTVADAQWDSTTNRWLGVCYAANIKAGSNTVTATFNGSRTTRRMIVHEYSGVALTNPVDVTAKNNALGATGANAITSNAAITTVGGDLIFGAVLDTTSTTTIAAGTGFTQRASVNNKDLATQDRVQTVAGSIASTQTFGAAHRYSAIMVAFRPVAPDIQAPTTPTGVVAQVVNASQVNLSWTASTDNVGVTGYKIYRDGVQVGTSTATNFQNTDLTANTSYTYTVAAYDLAGNTSAQSAGVNATTPAVDNTPPSVSMSAPLPGTTVSGNVTVSGSASDNVGVVGVQFLLDGVSLGAEDQSAPYAVQWDSTTATNGTHTLTARARDAAGNTMTTSGGFIVTVSNTVATPADLMGGWTFNENIGTTVADASGNGNTLSLNGTPTWGAGKYGGGMVFSGDDDLVAPNSPSLNVSGSLLSLEMWINPAGGGGDQVPLGKFWNPTMASPYYQYGIELTNGVTPVLEVGASGGVQRATMGSNLPVGQWSHLAITYDGSLVRFYLNGNLVNTPALTTPITARDSLLRLGADAGIEQHFKGSLDDLRIYKRALTQAQVQSDMLNPLNLPSSNDGLTVSVTAPANGSQVTGMAQITANADIENPNATITKVQFLVNGSVVGEDTTAPYAVTWDSRTLENGAYAVTSRVFDNLGNSTVSSVVNVTVVNSSGFVRETLAGGLDIPVTIEFLPGGNMLVGELKGKIKLLTPPYLNASGQLFNDLSSKVGTTGFEQGIYDITLDPNFATNHYYYVFYTSGTSQPHDRLSRFTANATLDGTLPGETVLYEDPGVAAEDHHGGSVAFANDGKIMFTTGDNFESQASQSLTSPRGKVHRINPDGTAPADNPFYDGTGPNWDSVYSLGLRNPYRAFYDAPTGRFIIGDVGGNVDSSNEEVNVAAPGANFGWPNFEGKWCPSSLPAPQVCANPLYDYEHNGQSASVTGGFVYRGSAFPSGFQGSYFFGDYTQHFIKRMTFDANGGVASVTDFEPAPGAGDVVSLTEGPDGALYFIDLGYSGIDPQPTGPSSIKRIRYVASNQTPSAIASANPVSGPAPLNVAFSSAGSMDPEGTPLTYSWDFGDGTSSTQANPTHQYAIAGQYVVRLTVSDGENSSFSTPLVISVGAPPTASITGPTDGSTFRAGEVINFAGDATDPEDDTLPASAYSWTIDFLHESHVHPGYSVSGVKNGTFTIPASGHDFSGNTRYRITLTVTDSNGLTNSKSVTIWPQKVSLSFDTTPTGLTILVDGVAHTAPFVYDTLVGFGHTIEARDQALGGTNYTFTSWSDGGAAAHAITVPSTNQNYTATLTAAQAPSGLKAAWGFNEASGITTTDSSGNNNTATLVNGPTRTAGQTGHGNALSLDGSNDNLSIPNSSSLDISGNAMTVSMWVKPGGGGGDQVVLGKFWNATMSSPYYQYGLEFQNGGLTPVFQIGTSTGIKEASLGSALSTTAWTHLTIVFNGTQAQFYVNGNLTATKPLAATITARGNLMRLGADASPSQYFKGVLDDVRIYGRTLTASEVQTDMNTAL